MESEAATIEEIVEEMMTTTKSERTTRVIDFDQEASMEQKKREGYFLIHDIRIDYGQIIGYKGIS